MTWCNWFVRGGVLAAAFLLVGGGSGARAAVIVNQGFNIQGQNVAQFVFGADSAATPVGFYDSTNPAINNNAGTTLKGTTLLPPGLANNTYSITFDAASVFGPGANNGLTVESASLFIDAISFFGSNYTVNVDVNGTPVGSIIPGGGSNQAPTVTGGIQPVLGEANNFFFFNLPPNLLNGPTGLGGDSTFTLTFTRPGGGGAVTLDGINIQAVLTPEPTSLAIFGVIGLAGAAYCGWARKKKPAVRA